MNKFDSLLNNLESSKNIYSLLKNVQDNKKLESQVWENFCSKQPPSHAKKYFRKHPKCLSNSSSEFGTSKTASESSSNEVIVRKGNDPQKVKLNEEASASLAKQMIEHIPSDSSFECVTIRKETKRCVRAEKSNMCTKAQVKKQDTNNQPPKGVRIKRWAEIGDDVDNVKLNRKNSSKDDIAKTRASKDTKNGLKKDVGDTGSTIRDNTDLKIKHIMQKTLSCIEDIRLQIDAGVEQPDGANDFERRRKRANEFASRFARNYLYQLNRQINDILLILKPKSGTISSRSRNNLQQKIVSSYQTILQGLQAYCGHLPTSVAISVPEKVKELLKQSFVLCETYRNSLSADINSNDKRDDITDVFEVRCKYLLEKLEESWGLNSAVSLVPSSRSKYSLLGCNDAKDGNNVQRKKNAMKSRFSMYTGLSSRKDVYWKRAVAAMAKKKFNVASKYKTAHFKHRPPYEKPVIMKPPSKHKIVERKSSGHLKVKSVMNDDTVTTMVQLQKQKEHELGIKESVSGCVDAKSSQQIVDVKSSVLTPLVEKVLEKINEQNKDMSQDQVKNILQGLVEMVQSSDAAPFQKTERDAENADELKNQREDFVLRNDMLEKLVCLLKDRQDGTKGDVLKENDAGDAREKASKPVETRRKERKKTITVSGARNAQLICIRDDDSLTASSEAPSPEPKETPKPAQTSDMALPNQETSERVPREETCQSFKPETSTKENEAPVKTKISSKISIASSDRMARMKISRIPKRSLRCLQMLPKQHALNVLQYKIQFLKSKKGNHMYKKSDTVQPWELMGLVADKILEELLVGVGQEIQLNEVIDKIYQSELLEEI